MHHASLNICYAYASIVLIHLSIKIEISTWTAYREERYLPAPASGAGADAGWGPTEELREVLRGLRGNLVLVDGMLEVTLDLFRRVDKYGPGLAFRVLIRDPSDQKVPPPVGEGGRIDHLLEHFGGVHTGSLLQPSQQEALGARGVERGVSMELAVDRLAAHLAQAAEAAQAAWAGRAVGQRGARAAAGPMPWWRSRPGCWPHVLVATEDHPRLAAFSPV